MVEGDFKLMDDFIKSVNNREAHIKTSAIDSSGKSCDGFCS